MAKIFRTTLCSLLAAILLHTAPQHAKADEAADVHREKAHIEYSVPEPTLPSDLGSACNSSVTLSDPKDNNASDNNLMDNNPTNNTPIDKYAVIFSPESYRDKPISDYSFDQGTRNAFLISIAHIYDSLKKMGYPTKNIRILYNDGTIDDSEPQDSGLIKALAKEKFGKDNKTFAATSANLESALAGLKGRIDDNDEFTFVAMGHGFQDGPTAYMDDFNGSDKPGRIYASRLCEWVQGIIAEDQLFVIDCCYSGRFGEELSGQGGEKSTIEKSTIRSKRAILTSSAGDSPSIISRADQFASFYFDAAVSIGSDLNNDGEITTEEALAYTENRRRPILHKHNDSGHLAFNPIEGFYAQKFSHGQGFTLYKRGGQD